MSPAEDLDGGLSLREAWEHLVDRELLEDLQAKIEAQKSYNDRAIASHGRPPRVRYGGERQPRHPLRSEDYKTLQRATAVAHKAALKQFYSRLLRCWVMARKQDPDVPLAEIPASALPSPSSNDPSRLRIYSLDKSQMAFGRGDKKITYYDVRVWPPEQQASTTVELAAPDKPAVSDGDLMRFLTSLVASLDAGHPDLAEGRLWHGAKVKFPHLSVTRQRVRAWIKTDMPPHKRFKRGQKPKPISV